MSYSPDGFTELMSLDASLIRPAAAALHLARDEYPHLRISEYLCRLDGLAERVRRLGAGSSPRDRIAALNKVLVDGEELRGATTDYEDPCNSYLNIVLNRKRGIPITLSLIWMDVARLLGWPLCGIGFPGHFLVGHPSDRRMLLFDPYNGGVEVSPTDCRTRLRATQGPAQSLRPEHLAPIGIRPILIRMLGNLRAIYLEREDWARAERVLRRMLVVEPHCGSVARQLGLVVLHRGRTGEATNLLRRALELTPQSDEAHPMLQHEFSTVLRRWTAMN